MYPDIFRTWMTSSSQSAFKAMSWSISTEGLLLSRPGWIIRRGVSCWAVLKRRHKPGCTTGVNEHSKNGKNVWHKVLPYIFCWDNCYHCMSTVLVIDTVANYRQHRWHRWQNYLVLGSVVDPGCLSWILIFTHSGSRFPGPGSKNSNKREGWKKISFQTFFL